MSIEDPDIDVVRVAPSTRTLARLILALILLAPVVLAIAFFLGRGAATAEIGELSETQWERPDTVPMPIFSDATESWGLDGFASSGRTDPMAGGSAVADLDGDGDLDLIVANGSVQMFSWDETGYQPPRDLGLDEAMAVSTADVDSDGWIDLLVARTGDEDTIVWGGPWLERGGIPQTTDLEGAKPSSMLLASELTGDTMIDIVRVGRGNTTGAPDVLWVRTGAREFARLDLTSGNRLSLAAELVDIDQDGLLDIWITRDLGWSHGGDALLSRQGDVGGEWIDVSDDLGSYLKVDGMGVTVADLNGDQVLDAYVSDLGDNELLFGGSEGFVRQADTGAARIRAPGADPASISSSWASGGSDLNLDGQLDLFVVNGGFPDGGVDNKIPGTWVTVLDSPSLLLGIGNGRFVDVWPELEVELMEPARGMTIADLDGDGDDDLLVVLVTGEVRAYRNESEAPSLTISPADGCDPAGAVATVWSDSTSFQSLLSPHTFAGAHSSSLIVGTDGTNRTVTVDWPGGYEERATAPSDAGRTSLSIGCSG